VRRLLLLASILGLLARDARADAAPEASAEARTLFERGVAEARLGHWQEALIAFQAAYALAPKPAVLFNLAAAQLRTGRLLVSMANYRRFLASEAPEIGSAHRRSAAQQVALIEDRIPRLRVAIEGLRPEDHLLLDDKRLYANELNLDLWVDPGAHTVSVHREGGHEEVRRLVLVEGEHRTLQFRVF
jgi:tetratricopeptide (TPR) repeat protein